MEEKRPDQKGDSSLRTLYTLLRDRWPEYVLEIIVIILSISISFALDEWKDRSHKQELEQLYLKELARDIETDSGQLAEIIAETGQVIQKTNSLAALTQTGSLPNYTQFIDDVRFSFKRPRFVAQDATFSDLKSTGNMQFISNFRLKSALFDYYKQYESIALVETAEMESVNTVLGPYIVKRLPLANGSKPIPDADVARLLKEVEFQNGILLRRSTRQELLGEYREIRQHGKQILALIKAQQR